MKLLHLFTMVMITLTLAKGKEFTIQIPTEVCRKIVIEHKPRDDVAYKPGVDVKGNPVVGADLYGTNTVKVPDHIQIPLHLDLFKYFNLQNQPGNVYLDKAEVGNVDLYLHDNTVYFNGQPLQNDVAVAVKKACQEKMGQP